MTKVNDFTLFSLLKSMFKVADCGVGLQGEIGWSIMRVVIFNPHLSMTDRFTTTTTTGYGSRIMNSIKGVVGFILFVASFGVLYSNEGRVDMSQIAVTAVDISATTQDTANDGKLVSTTGVFTSEETIGDNMFLNADKYLAVTRKVEMYAWEETSESKSTTNVGGSETTETTYKYDKVWTENPQKSSDFKQPQGHENPAKTLEGDTVTVEKATLGVYGLDVPKLELPEFADLQLTATNVTAKDGAVLAEGGKYLFIAKVAGSSLNAPAVGDMRISYSVLYPGKDGTVFGKLEGSNISPYFDEKNNKLYRVFSGTRDEAIAQMHDEYTMMLWIFRAVGFLMMWIGLAALFGPISVLLDFLPVFGQISRALIGGIAFIVSLVLSGVTILVSMLLHNVVALVISIVVVVGVIIGVMIMIKKKKASGSGPAAPAAPVAPTV